jgi:putative peptidoglycan lipid II flippase
MDDEVTRNVGKISLITIISRILGFIRDMLFAFVFGTTYYSDAYFLAFRIPNSLRMLLGEGSLNAAFVPVFSSVLQEKDKAKINRVVSKTFTFLLLVLVLLTILGIIFSKQIIGLFTFSFDSMGEKEILAYKILRIMFPYLIFISLAALSMGILNSFKVFHIPAFMPVVLNISIISAIIIGRFIYRDDIVKVIFIVAIGVVIGGLLQFLIQQPFIIKRKVRLKLNFKLKDFYLFKIIKLMLPAIFGQTVFELSSLVDSILAWMLGAGAVSSLYYANRIMQLPHGVFGVAIATVTLPLLSHAVARKDKGGRIEFNDKLFHSLRLLILIMIPIIIILTLNAREIIMVLFARGSFSQESVNLTYLPLVFYSSGLIFYSGVKILATGFYAHQNTQVPVLIASFCFILNIELNMILMRYFAQAGLALATCISSGVNFTLLSINLKRYIIPEKFKKLIRFIGKVLPAGIITFLLAFYFNRFLCSTFQAIDFFTNLTKIIIFSAFVILIYFLSNSLFGNNILKYVRKGLRKSVKNGK